MKVGDALVIVGMAVLFALTPLAYQACGNGSVARPAWADADCDTTFIKVGDDEWRTRLIHCTTTVIETVFVAVDFECVEDCLEIKGLGHWRECLEVCVPAHE